VNVFIILSNNLNKSGASPRSFAKSRHLMTSTIGRRCKRIDFLPVIYLTDAKHEIHGDFLKAVKVDAGFCLNCLRET